MASSDSVVIVENLSSPEATIDASSMSTIKVSGGKVGSVSARVSAMSVVQLNQLEADTAVIDVFSGSLLKGMKVANASIIVSSASTVNTEGSQSVKLSCFAGARLVLGGKPVVSPFSMAGFGCDVET